MVAGVLTGPLLTRDGPWIALADAYLAGLMCLICGRTEPPLSASYGRDLYHPGCVPPVDCCPTGPYTPGAP